MTKKRKLLAKIERGSKNVRFGELLSLIEGFGFTLDRISGSHHIFEHPAIPQGISLQPDKNNRAKPYQVRQFLKLVERYNLQLEDEESEDVDQSEEDNEDDEA